MSETSAERPRVIVSGASGLVGTALVPALAEAGYEVIRLVRHRNGGPGTAPWEPSKGTLDPAVVDGAAAVIHLSGENIAAGRWTRAKKKRILESRVRSTRLLAETLAGLYGPGNDDAPKPTFVSTSAIGIYGDQGARELDENAPQGDGFLADVCQRWEAAASAARDAGIRVVHPRLGVVLAKEGGALEQMARPVRFGAGGPLGTGNQYVSWITLRDVVRVFLHLLHTPDLDGPVNVVAPQAIPQRQLAKSIGKVLHRPSLLPAPAFALRIALGEMADEVLLASQRIVPRVLENQGFEFEDPTLDGALERLLG